MSTAAPVLAPSGPAGGESADAAAGWAAFSHAWAAHSVSTFGDRFSMVALPLATFARTESALAVGVVASMEGITAVLFGLFAGVLADRLRRRRMMVATDLARAVVLGLLGLAILGSHYPVALLFVAALLLGALRVVHDASAAAVIPLLVGGPGVVRANGRMQASESAATAVGPAVAGGLIAVGGPALAFAADAATFALSGATVGRVRRLDETTAVSTTWQGLAGLRDDIREGFRTLIADRWVVRALVLVAAMNVVATAAEAQFIPYAREVLRISSAEVGLYFALGGAVGVVASLVAGRHTQIHGRCLLQGVGVFSAGFLAAGLWPSRLTAALAFAAAGLGSTLTLTHFYSLRQRRFPVHLQGRVAMVTRIALLGMLPVAYVAGGALARAAGPATLFVVVAAVGMVATAWGVLVGLGRLRLD